MNGPRGPSPSEPAAGATPEGRTAVLLTTALILAGGLAGPMFGAVLVLAWVRWSRRPWSALGLVRPRRWTRTLLGGAVAGVAFKLGTKALVMPLLGAPPVNATYGYLAGNTAALPGIVARIMVSAAFSEEVLYRGSLLGRLRVLLGTSKTASAGAILLAALLFGAAHVVDQGWPGALQVAITGVVFGGFFLWRRELGAVIVMHTAFDLTAVVLIYHGWEAVVAGLLIR